MGMVHTSVVKSFMEWLRVPPRSGLEPLRGQNKVLPQQGWGWGVTHHLHFSTRDLCLPVSLSATQGDDGP